MLTDTSSPSLESSELADAETSVRCYSSPPSGARKLAASSGAYAELGANAEGRETLRVISARQELLFELDPATGVTRVVIPSGRLELSSGGDLVLRAAGAVRVEGNSVELQGRQRIALAVARGASAASTWLRLLPGRLQLGGNRFELSAREGEFALDQAHVCGTKLVAEAEHCQLQAIKLETVAETVIERAGNVYRTVRDLVQLQAGRWRTYVAGLSHFRSQRAFFSSENSFHIDGDQVNLG